MTGVIIEARQIERDGADRCGGKELPGRFLQPIEQRDDFRSVGKKAYGRIDHLLRRLGRTFRRELHVVDRVAQSERRTHEPRIGFTKPAGGTLQLTRGPERAPRPRLLRKLDDTARGLEESQGRIESPPRTPYRAAPRQATVSDRPARTAIRTRSVRGFLESTAAVCAFHCLALRTMYCGSARNVVKRRLQLGLSIHTEVQVQRGTAVHSDTYTTNFGRNFLRRHGLFPCRHAFSTRRHALFPCRHAFSTR